MNTASNSRSIAKLVFWPIVRNALAFGLAYSGLHWLGVHTFGAGVAHEAAREVAIPVVFAFILYLPLIWPHLRRMDPTPAAALTSLKFSTLRPLESVFALALFAIPTIVTQPVVAELAMRTVTIGSTDEIFEQDQADAFIIRQLEIDASTMTLSLDTYTSHDRLSATDQWVYTIWAAAQAVPSMPNERGVWIGRSFTYHGDQKYNVFTIQNLRKQAREYILSITPLVTLERVTNRRDHKGILRAIRESSTGPDEAGLVVLTPREVLDGWLQVQPWGMYAFILFALLLLVVLRLARKHNVEDGSRGYGIRDAVASIFITPYPADPLLIRFGLALSVIFVVASLVMMAAGFQPLPPDPDSLAQWGALRPSDLGEGSLWKLLTYSFVHYDAIVLCASLGLLWIAILILYPLQITREVIVAYCIMIITSAATSVLAYDLGGKTEAPFILAGAAAPIAGLYGFALVRNRDNYPKPLRSITNTLLGIGLITTWTISTFLEGSDEVSWAAGVMMGAITGRLFVRGERINL